MTEYHGFPNQEAYSKAKFEQAQKAEARHQLRKDEIIVCAHCRIVPEVKKFLVAEKGAILEAALVAAREVGDMLTKKMVESAAEKLSHSWHVSSIMKELFA